MLETRHLSSIIQNFDIFTPALSGTAGLAAPQRRPKARGSAAKQRTMASARAFSFMNAAAASDPEEEKTSGSLDDVKWTAIEGKDAAPKKKKKVRISPWFRSCPG